MRAGIAQLVEHKLPKLGVASSILVSRSSLLLFSEMFFGVTIPPCSCQDLLLFQDVRLG